MHLHCIYAEMIALWSSEPFVELLRVCVRRGDALSSEEKDISRRSLRGDEQNNRKELKVFLKATERPKNSHGSLSTFIVSLAFISSSSSLSLLPKTGDPPTRILPSPLRGPQLD